MMKRNHLILPSAAAALLCGCIEPDLVAAGGPCDAGGCLNGGESGGFSTDGASFDTGAPASTGPGADTGSDGSGWAGGTVAGEESSGTSGQDDSTTGELPTPLGCGDGHLDDDEVCDDGANNGAYGACAWDCAGPGPRCGDGVRDVGPEMCDDGNRESDDGCDIDCRPSAVTDIESGREHNCVITRTGAVKCWGYNNVGQLGYGHRRSIGGADGTVPADVGTLELGGKVRQLALGAEHSCALLEGGDVKCWGAGGHGRLGYGDERNVGDTERLGAVGFVRVDPGHAVVQLAAGAYHTCARLDDGTVRCWGGNDLGQAGLGTLQSTAHAVPAAVPAVDLGAPAIDVVAGDAQTCVRLGSEAVRCWGSNSYGQLGIGTVGGAIGDGPHEVRHLPDITLARADGPTLHATALEVGSLFTCAATGGIVRCWGLGQAGQLGTGILEPRPRPDSFSVATLAGTGSQPVLQLVSGAAHTCVVDSTGRVRCWGANAFGQLGDGTLITRGTPQNLRAAVLSMGVDASTGEALTVVDLSAGHDHTCALLSNGALRCWGANGAGQLGYGDVVPRVERPANLPGVAVF